MWLFGVFYFAACFVGPVIVFRFATLKFGGIKGLVIAIGVSVVALTLLGYFLLFSVHVVLGGSLLDTDGIRDTAIQMRIPKVSGVPFVSLVTGSLVPPLWKLFMWQNAWYRKRASEGLERYRNKLRNKRDRDLNG